jgi:hypothetical protein
MMNRTHPHHAAARHWVSRQAALEAIEWEELPSLAQSLHRREFASTRGVWSSTERMDLCAAPAPAPAPFVESIHGLHVREIDNDEVFRHFFGDPSANH